jgi:hypothetical protein
MSTRNLITRFARDESGNYVIIVALLLPALVGVCSFAIDGSMWLMSHRSLQNAADSAAFSGAASQASGSALFAQAAGVSATYGYVQEVDDVTVTVNRPPKSGPHTATAKAVEVILQKLQNRSLSAIFGPGKITISARAVAIPGKDGQGCVLALSGTASGAATGQGSTAVNLKNCSLYDNSNSPSALTVGGSATLSALSVNVVGGISGQASVSTTDGTYTGTDPATDPYASVPNPTPSGPTVNNCCSHGTATMNPGVYQNGMKLVAGANITLNPGTYYLQGDLSVAGGATLSGTGVTLVFTSKNGSNYAAATINGNANINLTAPTSGDMAGIVMFGDRNMPVGTAYKLNGGSTQSFGGALYLPKGAVDYTGGASSSNGCTQLVANTVTFSGNSNFAINCSGSGTKPIGTTLTKLVE